MIGLHFDGLLAGAPVLLDQPVEPSQLAALGAICSSRDPAHPQSGGPTSSRRAKRARSSS